MPEERLQKIMSRAGVCSRRRAEELIEAGLVTVNGRIAVLGDRADAAEDAIKVDGKRVPPAVPNRYILLHKPEGYMSTVSDPEGRPTVFDLIPTRLRRALVPVGRLDYNTEGLLLLTTDGAFAQRVAHPRFGCKKVYEVKVKGMPDDGEVARLREGMWIDGKRTEPADVSFLRRTKARGQANNTWWRVTLGEGRTRQVREMFFRVGHPVQRLRRIAIGDLEDPGLDKGSWRDLTPAEVRSLMDPSPSEAVPQKDGRRQGGERKRRVMAAAVGESRRAKRRPRRSPGEVPGRAAEGAPGRPAKSGDGTRQRGPVKGAGSKGGASKGRPGKSGPSKGRSGQGRSGPGPSKGRRSSPGSRKPRGR